MFWSYPHMYSYNPLGGFFSFCFSIFFIIVFVYLVITLFRSHRSDESETELEDELSALDILKKRYAKGEINKKEFEQMKKDIR